MIHHSEGDVRVPRPQGEELYMALKSLGVPTELIVYPGASHGVSTARNRVLQATIQFNWFQHWIRGKPGVFDWASLNALVESPPKDSR